MSSGTMGHLRADIGKVSDPGEGFSPIRPWIVDGCKSNQLRTQ